MTSVEDARKFYAQLMAANAGSADPRLEEAFSAVPREAFLGPGAWTVDNVWFSSQSLDTRPPKPRTNSKTAL